MATPRDEGPPVASSGRVSPSETCVHCSGSETPLWCAGHAGTKTLCNKCGLAFRKGTLIADASAPSGLRPAACIRTEPRLSTSRKARSVRSPGHGDDDIYDDDDDVDDEVDDDDDDNDNDDNDDGVDGDDVSAGFDVDTGVKGNAGVVVFPPQPDSGFKTKYPMKSSRGRDPSTSLTDWPVLVPSGPTRTIMIPGVPLLSPEYRELFLADGFVRCPAVGCLAELTGESLSRHLRRPGRCKGGGIGAMDSLCHEQTRVFMAISRAYRRAVLAGKDVPVDVKMAQIACPDGALARTRKPYGHKQSTRTWLPPRKRHSVRYASTGFGTHEIHSELNAGPQREEGPTVNGPGGCHTTAKCTRHEAGQDEADGKGEDLDNNRLSYGDELYEAGKNVSVPVASTERPSRAAKDSCRATLKSVPAYLRDESDEEIGVSDFENGSIGASEFENGYLGQLFPLTVEQKAGRRFRLLPNKRAACPASGCGQHMLRRRLLMHLQESVICKSEIQQIPVLYRCIAAVSYDATVEFEKRREKMLEEESVYKAKLEAEAAAAASKLAARALKRKRNQVDVKPQAGAALAAGRDSTKVDSGLNKLPAVEGDVVGKDLGVLDVAGAGRASCGEGVDDALNDYAVRRVASGGKHVRFYFEQAPDSTAVPHLATKSAEQLAAKRSKTVQPQVSPDKATEVQDDLLSNVQEQAEAGGDAPLRDDPSENIMVPSKRGRDVCGIPKREGPSKLPKTLPTPKRVRSVVCPGALHSEGLTEDPTIWKCPVPICEVSIHFRQLPLHVYSDACRPQDSLSMEELVYVEEKVQEAYMRRWYVS